jgi:hypothetical protein
MEMPSSFSEDETAETSSSLELGASSWWMAESFRVLKAKGMYSSMENHFPFVPWEATCNIIVISIKIPVNSGYQFLLHLPLLTCLYM